MQHFLGRPTRGALARLVLTLTAAGTIALGAPSLGFAQQASAQQPSSQQPLSQPPSASQASAQPSADYTRYGPPPGAPDAEGHTVLSAPEPPPGTWASIWTRDEP